MISKGIHPTRSNMDFDKTTKSRFKYLKRYIKFNYNGDIKENVRKNHEI